MNNFKVVKYEEKKASLIYKYPIENLDPITKLVVSELQEVIIFEDRRELVLLEPGKYTLKKHDTSLFEKLFKTFDKKRAKLDLEIYFINKENKVSIKWGLGNIDFSEPNLDNHTFKIGLSGEASLHISNSEKLFKKLIDAEMELDENTFTLYLKQLVRSQIKTLLPKFLKECKYSIFELEFFFDNILEKFTKELSELLVNYGISLEEIQIKAISLPENDPVFRDYKKHTFKELSLKEIDLPQIEINKEFNHIQNENKENDLDDFIKGIGLGQGIMKFAPFGTKENLDDIRVLPKQEIDSNSVDSSSDSINSVSSDITEKVKNNSKLELEPNHLKALIENNKKPKRIRDLIQQTTRHKKIKTYRRILSNEFLHTSTSDFIPLNQYNSEISTDNILDNLNKISENQKETDNERTKTQTKNSFLNKVRFSALAPKELNKGNYTIITVVLYEKNFRNIVDEIIQDSSEPIKETHSGVFKVKENTKIRIVLTSPNLEIEDNEEELIWSGDYLSFMFDIYVPDDYGKKQILFKADIYIDDIPLTKLKFLVKIKAEEEQQPTITREDILSAFISYASQDRHRVAAIVQGMQKIRPDLDIFFDVESLRSGEDWERALHREINKRDILYLCWSRNARSSKWVDFEWRYALSQKGIDGIEPIPIETPELCPPPEELSQKHFNDKLIYLIDSTKPKEKSNGRFLKNLMKKFKS